MEMLLSVLSMREDNLDDCVAKYLEKLLAKMRQNVKGKFKVYFYPFDAPGVQCTCDCATKDCLLEG